MPYPKVDVPTEPGLYWFRFDDKQPWLPIEAFVQNGELLFQRRGYSACLACGLVGDATEYRGPIPEPAGSDEQPEVGEPAESIADTI